MIVDQDPDVIGGEKATENWNPLSFLDMATSNRLATRRVLETEMVKRRPDLVCKSFQLDVAVAVAGGEDVLGISAPGTGKSMCFQLLAGIPHSTHIIISPLRGLVSDQAKELERIGISAIGLTADAMSKYGPGLWEDITRAKFQFVISAPEIICNPECVFWKLRSITVDEAHMVWKWAGVVDRKSQALFRADFRHIGSFRILLPEVPFLLLSATITPVVRGYLFEVMKLHRPSYICRCSIKRTNIRVLFSTTTDARSANTFSELNFLLQGATDANDARGLKKTIIYTDERNRAQDIVRYMRNTLLRELQPAARPTREEMRRLMFPYTGYYDDFSKDTHMDNFKRGEALMMVCTEAAGSRTANRKNRANQMVRNGTGHPRCGDRGSAPYWAKYHGC